MSGCGTPAGRTLPEGPATRAAPPAPAPEPQPSCAEALARPVEGLNPARTLFPGVSAGRGDYVSYAIYYWPNPATADGMPYVSRDGKKNEVLIAMGDAPRLRAFLETTTDLGRAWARTRDPACAAGAGAWLRTWLLDPSTRMNPNLTYSQIRPGTTTVGHGGGIIDMANLPPMLDAIEPLRGSGALTDDEWAGVDAWFREYRDWLVTSPQGAFERKNTNNHFPYHMGQLARLSLFLGDREGTRAFLDEAFARLGDYIAPDGSQPTEVKRVKGFEYSIYALEAWQRLARIGDRVGIDCWSRRAANGATLDAAYRYLERFAGPKGKPWPQTGKPFPSESLKGLMRPGQHRTGPDA